MEQPTDKELRELLALQLSLKYIEDRIEQIKDSCRRAGSFASDNYVCTVIPQFQTRLAGLDEVRKVIGLEILERNNLIKNISFTIVKVAPKQLVYSIGG